MLRAAMEFCSQGGGDQNAVWFVGLVVEKRIFPLRSSLCKLLRSK